MGIKFYQNIRACKSVQLYTSNCAVLPYSLGNFLLSCAGADFFFNLIEGAFLINLNWLWDTVKTSEHKHVIDIVIMIGLHIVRCAELDYFPLLYHVPEHTIVVRDVRSLNLTCTDFLTISCHLRW